MTRPPLICLVSDRRVTPIGELPQLARDAAHAGVDLIHIRERDLDDGELLALVRAVVAATAGTRARVVVNERADIAIAGSAAGVHLRGDSVAANRVRAWVPPGFLVGRAVHSADEALGAERAGGCDYLVFGSVFPTPSKPDGPTSGTEGLRRVCEAVRVPVLGIGGIALDNVEQVARAGAAGISAIRLFARETGLAERIAAVRAAFDRVRAIPENERRPYPCRT